MRDSFKYKPLEHQDTISKNPFLLETYGADYILLDDFPSRQVWSLVLEEDNYIIKAGKNIIGLVGYIVTKEEWNNKKEIFKPTKTLLTKLLKK